MLKHHARIALLALAFALAVTVPVLAQMAMMFNNVDQYIDRSFSIWIIEDVRQIDTGLGYAGGPRHQVRILQTLKGPVRDNTLSVASVFRQMVPGERYLLFGFNLEHLPPSSDYWMDNGNISPVPIPRSFSLDQLKGKPLKEQLELILSARSTEIENQIKDLNEENAAIKAGLGR